ncbi:uncharacterized protein PGTG_06645 [Puccinia graminis f. sp. tritici CRL 75-36-700-3]|uniref:Uncharacterized protein n=1 Tax=Puccinia graminis f. sp. tritici (strain CRL 75-36-700-3 / race SCCL) TaxID=418459 RepID=E3K953_PUCGT|nr:uncharacterized protein PGTG_06645 [Puccinia graminis f. sp. tritici CRL 75-36-700-3]EFP80689.2 hypothetical protein PGTG_06645 [Puccinia graminis f. sp. tritici CRL 75-36-700-3]
MVKHERTHLRNLLLTHVRQDARPRELGPIPKIFDLIILIDRSFQPRNTLRSAAEIRGSLTSDQMVQFAMIRLLTIHHHLHRAPGDTRSQWDVIDDQFEAIREKSNVQLHALSILILRCDRALFPGDFMFADIPEEIIRMPSVLDCEIKTRAIVAELGEEPTDEALARLVDSEAGLV